LSNFLFSPLVASKASSDALPLLAAGVGGYSHHEDSEDVTDVFFSKNNFVLTVAATVDFSGLASEVDGYGLGDD
jgi:hypothetical protein